MRATRTILIVFVLLGGALWVLFALQSPYLRFTQRDSAYYRQFADACDSLLQQHPIGTNDWVYRRGVKSQENSIEIFGKDPSLPRIIRALGPDYIVISSNRVFIGVGVRRHAFGAFGMTWSQDEGSNGWSLRTYAESLEKTLYETTKFSPGANTR